LLAVSSNCELAVLTNIRFLGFYGLQGTLARVKIGDTAPIAVQNDVRKADWSPDGSQLAILRPGGSKNLLEYPPGHVLYEWQASRNILT
jgi:hypothetical protein